MCFTDNVGLPRRSGDDPADEDIARIRAQLSGLPQGLTQRRFVDHAHAAGLSVHSLICGVLL
ncbi:hypothetical protein ACWCZ5_12995, partial [Streptomyces sp. NPDC001667]